MAGDASAGAVAGASHESGVERMAGEGAWVHGASGSIRCTMAIGGGGGAGGRAGGAGGGAGGAGGGGGAAQTSKSSTREATERRRSQSSSSASSRSSLCAPCDEPSASALEAWPGEGTEEASASQEASSSPVGEQGPLVVDEWLLAVVDRLPCRVASSSAMRASLVCSWLFSASTRERSARVSGCRGVRRWRTASSF